MIPTYQIRIIRAGCDCPPPDMYIVRSGLTEAGDYMWSYDGLGWIPIPSFGESMDVEDFGRVARGVEKKGGYGGLST